jgi:hypothetical protein
MISSVCASEKLAALKIACHGSVSRAIAESALPLRFQADRGIAAAAWNRTAETARGTPPFLFFHQRSSGTPRPLSQTAWIDTPSIASDDLYAFNCEP